MYVSIASVYTNGPKLDLWPVGPPHRVPYVQLLGPFAAALGPMTQSLGMPRGPSFANCEKVENMLANTFVLYAHITIICIYYTYVDIYNCMSRYDIYIYTYIYI